MRLSKSKINTYLKCPFEFKLQYIDKIEVKPNKYMILGSDVHLLAEKFIEKNIGKINDVDIANELVKLSFEYDIGYDLQDHIENLSEFFRDFLIERDFKLFSFEEHIFDEKNNFSGICDIIFEDENGDLVIIDYKTGNSSSFSKYRLELCYYKLLVENVFKKNVSYVGIFFTKNGRLRLLKVDDIDNKRKFLKSDEIDEAIETMYHVRNEIDNGNFYQNKQFLCKLCLYKDYCDNL